VDLFTANRLVTVLLECAIQIYLFTRQRTAVNVTAPNETIGGRFRFNLYCLTSEIYGFRHTIGSGNHDNAL